MQTEPSTQGQRGELLAYYWGTAILIVGLVSAGLVYAFAPDETDTDAVAQMASQRMYEHNLELMGGKFAVYWDEFARWLASLWHGKALAYTIAALTFAAALGCFCVAQLISRPRQSEQPQAPPAA